MTSSTRLRQARAKLNAERGQPKRIRRQELGTNGAPAGLSPELLDLRQELLTAYRENPEGELWIGLYFNYQQARQRAKKEI